MADDVDSVQCPVCAREFQPATINAHLDRCLTENENPTLSTTGVDEPPSKKSRMTTEFSPSASTVTSAWSGMKSNRTAPVFQYKQRMSVLASKPNTISSATNKSTNRDVGQDEEDKGSDENNCKSKIHGALSSTNTKSSMISLTLLNGNKPLAEKLRPTTFEEYFGQKQVLGEHTLLRTLLNSQEIPSLILWGPPGCGKVTLNRVQNK